MIKKWWLSYKRRKALRNIRIGMVAVGFDLSSHSDEQLEVALFKGMMVMMKAGISAEDFARAVNATAATFRVIVNKWVHR